MANYRITYFLEDLSHEQFIVCLTKRVLDENTVISHQVRHDVRNAQGGDLVQHSLTRYLRDILHGYSPDGIPNLLVVARDTNKAGRVTREQQIQSIINKTHYNGEVVLALPEPYIEAWYFSDPRALQQAFSLSATPTVPSGEPRREQ